MRNKVSKIAGWIFLAAISIALVAIVVATFGRLPKYVLAHTVPVRILSAVQLADAESDIRGSLLQAVGGILLVIGAITAWRQMLIGRRQHILDRHVAVTEAFTKAIEYLGNQDAVDVRLGGIYSLDRVADDDPAERSRVVELLLAFIRERSPSEGDLPRDVLAAVAVLTRRQWPAPIDLSAVNLGGAQLNRAQLLNAQLRAADLNGAILIGATLRYADLSGADLRKADLSGADLRDACLIDARLSGASANSITRWPDGFIPAEHGVLIR